MNILKFQPDNLRAMIKEVKMTEDEFFLALVAHAANDGRVINKTYWREWMNGNRGPREYVSYMQEVLRAKGLKTVMLLDFFAEVPLESE